MAVAGPAHQGDWRLGVDAGLHGATVVPVYTVLDPAGMRSSASAARLVPPKPTQPSPLPQTLEEQNCE